MLPVLISALYTRLYIAVFLADFMSLEIERGYARLLVDYGSGTVSVEQRQIKLTDGKSHRVDILWSKTVSFVLYLILPVVMSCLVISMAHEFSSYSETRLTKTRLRKFPA
jgi:hypothetical protein